MGNIEVKESYSYNNMFTYREKDKDSQYILFYSHLKEEFHLVLTKDLNLKAKKGGIRFYTVNKKSFFKTKDVCELLDKINPLLDIKYKSE